MNRFFKDKQTARTHETRAFPAWLWPWLIAAAGVLVYAGTFGHPFLFDDATAITANRSIGRLWPIGLSARWVVNLTFRLNYALAGFNPADYRAVNIAIHVLNGLLLFGVLRRLLCLPRTASRIGPAAPVLAGVAALLWTVHPLATQAVTYVCQRYESLMAFFMLATLYTFLRGVESTRLARRGAARLWFDLAVLLCLLGMGTKEVMAMTPFVVLALDLIVIGGRWGEALRERWRVHLALFLCIGALLALQLRMTATLVSRSASLVPDISPWQYLWTQTAVLSHYLRLSLWPTGLCLDYAWPLASGFRAVWPAAVFILALGLTTLRLTLRRNPLAMPGLWFFLILAPSSSFIPVADAAFEHRMYLPLAAVVLAAVLAGWRLVSWRAFGAWRRPMAILLVTATTLAAGARTLERNADYASQERMWRDVIAKAPHNYRQHAALIMALHEEGRLEEAAAECRALLLTTHEALRNRNKDVFLSPASDAAFYYAVGLEELGRVRIAQERPEEAMAWLQQSWAAWPGRANVAHNLAVAAFMSDDRAEALRWARQATAMDRGRGNTRAFLAFLLAVQGDHAAARLAYEQALIAEPHLLFARLELAWLLATSPDAALRDGPRALALAQSVLADTGGAGIRPMQTLAAALAECGRFDEAVELAEAALGLARERRRAGDGPDETTVTPWGPSLNPVVLAAHVEAYRAGKPLWR